MNKKIFNLPNPDPQGKQINYKNIIIAIAVLVAIVVLSFTSFRKNKDKGEKKGVTNSSRIEESEAISTTEEMQEIVNSNPVVQAGTYDNSELEKLKLEKEYELKMLQEKYRQERLAWEQARRSAALTVIQGKNTDMDSKKDTKPINPYAGIEIPPFPDYPKEDPNLQELKRVFAENSKIDDFVLTKQLQPPVSKYEVKAGTIIPLTLETAINSDLPGRITAVVKTDVFDSATGTILLIPAGSRVIGRYSSDVSFGQERVQVVFNRITLPNQKSINIESMLGVDKLGASGVTDKVDTKMRKVFASVIMSAILGVGAGAVKEDNDDDNDEWKNDAINGGGTQAINVGNTYANQVLNVQPSLKIRQGFTVGLFVEKDLILEAYKR